MKMITSFDRSGHMSIKIDGTSLDEMGHNVFRLPPHLADEVPLDEAHPRAGFHVHDDGDAEDHFCFKIDRVTPCNASVSFTIAAHLCEGVDVAIVEQTAHRLYAAVKDLQRNDPIIKDVSALEEAEGCFQTNIRAVLDGATFDEVILKAERLMSQIMNL